VHHQPGARRAATRTRALRSLQRQEKKGQDVNRSSTTAAIRDMIALSPCTVEELSQFIGEPRRRIINCLSGMKARGEVVRRDSVKNSQGRKVAQWSAAR
jgi:hypothetical protein